MTGVIEVMGVPTVVGRADVVWCDRGDGCAYSGG